MHDEPPTPIPACTPAEPRHTEDAKQESRDARRSGPSALASKGSSGGRCCFSSHEVILRHNDHSGVFPELVLETAPPNFFGIKTSSETSPTTSTPNWLPRGQQVKHLPASPTIASGTKSAPTPARGRVDRSPARCKLIRLMAALVRTGCPFVASQHFSSLQRRLRRPPDKWRPHTSRTRR